MRKPPAMAGGAGAGGLPAGLGDAVHQLVGGVKEALPEFGRGDEDAEEDDEHDAEPLISAGAGLDGAAHSEPDDDGEQNSNVDRQHPAVPSVARRVAVLRVVYRRRGPGVSRTGAG